MHPKSNNIGHYFNAATLAYQGSAMAAGVGANGSAVALNQRASFVLVCGIAGSTGTPTSGTVTLAVEASEDGTTFAAVNDRDGNAVTLATTLAQGINSVNVDTQYFPAGSTHIRVVPTVAFDGGTSPAVSFVASIVVERADHL